MNTPIFVLGEALMDCLAQPDGRLLPLMGGSPFNMARAAALRGADVAYLNPLSTDLFGQGMAAQLLRDGVQLTGGHSTRPTALAVVQVQQGQPSYGFYREGIADRDYSVGSILALLRQAPQAGIFHTGSLLLIPPEHYKVLAILQAARAWGWTISVDINLRPQVAPDRPAYVQAVREIMALTDWLKASEEDLQCLGFTNTHIGESARLVSALRANAAPHTLSRVALSYGAQGAHLDIEGQSHSLPVPRIELKDTVGAGDTFWGNVVADWSLQADGAPQRVNTTLAQAMHAAALNCSQQGCQPPTWAQVQSFCPQV